MSLLCGYVKDLVISTLEKDAKVYQKRQKELAVTNKSTHLTGGELLRISKDELFIFLSVENGLYTFDAKHLMEEVGSIRLILIFNTWKSFNYFVFRIQWSVSEL